MEEAAPEEKCLGYIGRYTCGLSSSGGNGGVGGVGGGVDIVVMVVGISVTAACNE